MKMSTRTVENPKVVSREEWLVARKKLLAKEKQLTRQRDAIAAERRQLPWVKVEKNYAFDSPSGKKTLADLFDSYSAYARGSENTINTYNYLDLVPKGRDEDNLPFTMAWLRHHDRYETGYLADPDRPYWPKAAV